MKEKERRRRETRGEVATKRKEGEERNREQRALEGRRDEG